MSNLVFDPTTVEEEIDRLDKVVKRLRLDQLPSSTFYPWCKATDPEEDFFMVLHLPLEYRFQCQDVDNSFILNAVKEGSTTQ